MATVEKADPCPQRCEELEARVSALTEMMQKAIRDRDPYQQAVVRLERAWVEMCLRDLYGPWSPEAAQYEVWMRDDVRIARTLADTLAQKLGDGGLPERLLRMQPGLARVVAW